VRTNSALLGISKTSGKRGYHWELRFQKGQTRTIYLAKHVVLALPRVALERLDIQASGWQSITENLLPSVKPHNLLKIHLVYETPWWTGKSFLDADSGKIITDQPLRQIYYYGPEWIEKRTPKHTKKNQTATWPFIMASYCDSYYTEFWSTFFSRFWRREQGDPYFNETTNWQMLDTATKAELRNVRDREGVHWRMVNKIHRQLAELHNVSPDDLPKPILGLFMNWDWEPYHGGWHTWEVSGFPPWQAAHLMLEPVPGLYVCGEAYSDEQGWIEGALDTAEQVLVKKFKLSPL
jgi:monoamine oxidase